MRLAGIFAGRIGDRDGFPELVPGERDRLVAIAGGATTVDGITFAVADPAPLEREAREAAVADARAKADTLVRAAGTSITGVVSIAESVATLPWTWRDGMAAGPAGTPILPGTTEISVSVSMVYGLD